MLRAVLFDFNGILVDDEPLHMRLFLRVAEEEGLARFTEDEYWGHFVGLDDRAAFREILERSGERAEEPRLMRLTARKSSYYQELIRDEGYPYFPSAADLVRSLAARDAQLGVVSGALRDEVEGALAQEGLRDAFKLLVTAEDVAASKPDPEGYRRAIEGLNAVPPLPDRLLHPHEVVALEDTPAGIEAARAAGLEVIAVAHTCAASELAEAGRVVGSIAELDADDLLAARGG